MTRFPGNYLVMGDALCSFNPLYGQGMSVATLEALALRDCLEHAPSVARPLAAVLQGHRQDHRRPVDDRRRERLRVRGRDRREATRHAAVNWYLDRVHQAASTDRHVCRAFFDVANLLAPASSLFRPSILARVWRECVALRGPLAIESDRSITTRRHRMIETH